MPGGRSFYVWQEWHAENSRLLGKLRAAAQAMANLPVKRGLNQWQCVCEEEREAKRKLLEACRNIVNSQVRKAYSQWADICAAVNAKKEKLRAAIALLSPEGRAKKAVMLKLVWIRKRKLAMQKALAGFRLAGPRKALHHMLEQVHAMQKLRRGGAAIRNRKARAAYNAWAEAALAGAERKRKMEAALKRMSPEGRMLMAGFGAWLELLYELQGLRRAASGFINGSCKRAMTAWIEATFAVRRTAAAAAAATLPPLSLVLTLSLLFRAVPCGRLFTSRAGWRGTCTTSCARRFTGGPAARACGADFDGSSLRPPSRAVM